MSSCLKLNCRNFRNVKGVREWAVFLSMNWLQPDPAPVTVPNEVLALQCCHKILAATHPYQRMHGRSRSHLSDFQHQRPWDQTDHDAGVDAGAGDDRDWREHLHQRHAFQSPAGG